MEELKDRVNKLLEKFDVDKKRQEIRLIEVESMKPNFWQDHRNASGKMKELSDLQAEIAKAGKLKELMTNSQFEEAQKLLDELEVFLYLSGDYDKSSAILSIHAGQGGVEAMDWTQMLFRMYTRYFERKGFKSEIIDETIGEEAGYKSVTVTVDGKIKLGPTAIPALWRENYQGINRFSAREMISIFKREALLFLQNKFHFRDMALHELKKYSKKYLASQASYMVQDFNAAHYQKWGKPGIRAQLVDTRTNTLVTDFCIEKNDYSLHVLNAVSPAFTASFPFARHVVNLVESPG